MIRILTKKGIEKIKEEAVQQWKDNEMRDKFEMLPDILQVRGVRCFMRIKKMGTRATKPWEVRYIRKITPEDTSYRKHRHTYKTVLSSRGVNLHSACHKMWVQLERARYKKGITSPHYDR